ncbi:unnamed protein product [Closterium sp. Yama58-4]|nr:unnamed protein product [Closterium sp. Yama58-4]
MTELCVDINLIGIKAVADKEIRLRCARRRAPLDLLYELDKVEETITARVENIVSSLLLDSRQRHQDNAKDIAAESKEFALLLACGLQQPQDVPDAESLFRSNELSGEDAQKIIREVQDVVDSFTLDKVHT